MKIAIIVRTFSKEGGISGYSAHLAERFAKNDEVHIFASNWVDSGVGITFHKIPMLSFSFLKKRKKYAWNNVFEIWSFLFFSFFMVNPGKFDIVHSQGDYIGSFDMFTIHSCHKAWLALARSGKVSLLEWLKKSFFNPLHLNVLWVERHSIKTAKKIIAISNAAKNEIMKYYCVPEEKISVIYNGVDTVRFNIDNNFKFKREIRGKYNLNDSDFVIIFPAHEFKRKGLLCIIEALNKLKDKNIKVLVVGRDDSLPFAEIISKYNLTDKIIFAGKTNEIEKYYAASDLFVFPTVYEPFGLTITEAMASSLPIIVTENAGAAELMEGSGRQYLLKDPKDCAELAEKIVFLKGDPKLRRSLGQDARKIAEKYTWDIIADKTRSLYADVFNLKFKKS